MVILHLANIDKNMANGVNVVVPKHVYNQSKYAAVRLLNYSNIDVGIDELQLKFQETNFPNYLQEPFNSPDLVVIHGVNNFANIKIYHQLVKRRIPYIIVPHGELTSFALRKKWLKKKIAYFLFFNRFISHALAIQCLSNQELKDTHYQKEKFIGTNGVDLPSASKTKFSDQGIKLVYIGRLDAYHKGLDLLFSALAKLKDFLSTHQIFLQIYGPDVFGRKKTLESYIKKYEIQNFVEILQPVFGEEKEKAFLGADIFIQTSRFEGMPVGVLEAMSYGLPCILSSGTNFPKEIREECGFDAGSTVSGIVHAIEAACFKKGMWVEKGRNALNYVKQEYSWDNVAKQTIETYEKYVNWREN